MNSDNRAERAEITLSHPHSRETASVSNNGTMNSNNTGRSETSISNNADINKFARITQRRFELMKRSCLYNDLMVGLAIGGLFLAIVVQKLINDQLFGADVDSWNHPALICMRTVISAMTVALGTLNLLLQMSVFKLQSLETSPRSALLLVRVEHLCLTALEILLCAVHPLPYDFMVSEFVAISQKPFVSISPMNWNAYPTLFMFVRFYLVARCVLHHHVLYRTRIAHLFGRVDRIPIGYRFVFRCLMDSHTLIVLSAVISVVWFGGAWAIQTCDWAPEVPTRYYLNALWMVVITFFTVLDYSKLHEMNFEARFLENCHRCFFQ